MSQAEVKLISGCAFGEHTAGTFLLEADGVDEEAHLSGDVDVRAIPDRSLLTAKYPRHFPPKKIGYPSSYDLHPIVLPFPHLNDGNFHLKNSKSRASNQRRRECAMELAIGTAMD